MGKTIHIRGVPHVYELTAPTSYPHTLVFVHGWLLSREYWQPVIQRLAPSYQCLSYDLRGFGGSQPRSPVLDVSDHLSVPRSPHSVSPASRTGSQTATLTPESSAQPLAQSHSPRIYAEDLLCLLRTLDISQAWLIGHSLGGSISLWAADQSPEAIAGVVCVNSGGGIYIKEEFERFRTAGQQLLKLRPRWLKHLPLMELPMTWLNVVQPLERRWGRQRLLDLVNAHPEAALGTLLDSTTEAEVHRLPQLVAGLKQPVYFLAGMNDSVMEPKYVKHLASFHHSFECCGHNVVEIPHCGHLAMLEQPDAVSAHIQAIVSQHSQ